MKPKRIVITGGHLTPALAMIDEFLSRGNWQIFFFGRKQAMEGRGILSVEFQLITEKGLTFVPLIAGRLQRRFTCHTLPALFKVVPGFFQSVYYLLRFKPEVILSFGGYVSVPVVFGGWLLGIPVVTHEQTVTQGLANKINAFFARKMAFSWPTRTMSGKKGKAVFTGNPVRKEIFRVNEKIWRALEFEKNLPLIFITGGNQGAQIINWAVTAFLPKIVSRANVFHQCGHVALEEEFEKLQELREKLAPGSRKRYHLKRYLTAEEMGTILNKADLVISRAGANIVTELAALSKPALFIPLPWSYADEQNKNAQILVKAGTSEILPQEKLSGATLLKLTNQMLANLDRYQKNASRAKKLVRLNAAKRIVNLVEETIQ